MSYFDDNEDRIIYGGRYRHHSEAPRETRCKFCGSVDVKWRLADGGGWRLFNAQREHPGNRYVLHDCRRAPSADDFDVLP